MPSEKKKSKKELELEKQLSELTQDLQRTRADFENYRKRSDLEKTATREAGQMSAILKLLPVIDNIDRAVGYMPSDLIDNKWANGVSGVSKSLEKALESLGVTKIDAKVGTIFNPELHDAIQFDEDASGDNEVIAEELQSGYTLNGNPIRHAMVKVTRK